MGKGWASRSGRFQPRPCHQFWALILRTLQTEESVGSKRNPTQRVAVSACCGPGEPKGFTQDQFLGVFRCLALVICKFWPWTQPGLWNCWNSQKSSNYGVCSTWGTWLLTPAVIPSLARPQKFLPMVSVALILTMGGLGPGPVPSLPNSLHNGLMGISEVEQPWGGGGRHHLEVGEGEK